MYEILFARTKPLRQRTTVAQIVCALSKIIKYTNKSTLRRSRFRFIFRICVAFGVAFFLNSPFFSLAQEKIEFSAELNCIKRDECHKRTVEEVLNRFSNHAFGFERDPRKNPGLARWDTEIKAQLAGREGSSVINEVTRIFGELSVLSGVPVVAGKESANFIVVVDEDPLGHFLRTINEEERDKVFGFDDSIKQLRADMKVDSEPDCAGFAVIGGHPEHDMPVNPNIDLSHSIGFVLVLVQYSENTEKNLRCLYEEIYQGFGLFNDKSGETCTMFDNQISPSSPTNLDRLLVHLLYSDVLRSGMTRSEALLPLVRFMEVSDVLGKFVEGDGSCQG